MIVSFVANSTNRKCTDYPTKGQAENKQLFSVLCTALDEAVLLQFTLQDPGIRIMRPGGLQGREKCLESIVIGMVGEMVREETFELVVELRAMVGMVQMREFVEEDVVLERLRDAH